MCLHGLYRCVPRGLSLERPGESTGPLFKIFIVPNNSTPKDMMISLVTVLGAQFITNTGRKHKTSS